MIRVNYHGLFEDWRMDEMNAPIGVFDSGVGGLTVVKEIMRQLPLFWGHGESAIWK